MAKAKGKTLKNQEARDKNQEPRIKIEKNDVWAAICLGS